MCMGACGVGCRGEKEPFRPEFQVVHGAVDARSTSDFLLGEQAVAGHPLWKSLSTCTMNAEQTFEQAQMEQWVFDQRWKRAEALRAAVKAMVTEGELDLISAAEWEVHVYPVTADPSV